MPTHLWSPLTMQSAALPNPECHIISLLPQLRWIVVFKAQREIAVRIAKKGRTNKACLLFVFE